MSINNFKYGTEQYEFFWILKDYKDDCEYYNDEEFKKTRIVPKYLKLLEKFNK